MRMPYALKVDMLVSVKENVFEMVKATQTKSYELLA